MRTKASGLPIGVTLVGKPSTYSRPYRAQIRVGPDVVSLGYFADPYHAASIYNRAATIANAAGGRHKLNNLPANLPATFMPTYAELECFDEVSKLAAAAYSKQDKSLRQCYGTIQLNMPPPPDYFKRLRLALAIAGYTVSDEVWTKALQQAVSTT